MDEKLLMRRALLALALVAAGGGCAAVIGADFGDKKLAQCNPARAPGPPEVAGSGADISFVVAVRTVDWGEDEDDAGAPRYKTIGYDLDGVCSSLLDAPPCKPPSWTGVVPADGVDGRDNAVGALLYNQRSAFGGQPFNSPYLNEAVARGEHAPIAVFRVSDYNGFADDDQVTVEWFFAGALGAAGDGGAIAPKWDGTDAWPLVATAVDADGGGVRSRWVDARAYVSRFRLVARFAAGAQLRLANVPFTLTDSELSADIVPGETPSERELKNGLIVGHGTIAELLARLPELTQSFAGAAICTDAAAYPSIKRWLCSTADSLSASAGAPGSGADCDAASFGVAIDTRASQLGPIVPPSAPPRCAPAVDPANDTCATPAP